MARPKKHGKSNTTIYKCWADIKQRCNNPKDCRYYDYGGRGIKICRQWEEDFENFYKYVSKLENFGKRGYSIDRINNDDGYRPGNVRFATISQQNLNRRKYGKKNNPKL